MIKRFLAVILGLFFIAPLFAAYNSRGIPDSSEIRVKLREKWFEADLEDVRLNLPEVYVNDAGQKFQVRMEESESTFNIFVSPSSIINVKVITNDGERTEEQVFYPGDIPGSWVLIRDKKTGNPIRIRWYFLSNSEVYVQFTPHNKTCLADMVIFDNYVAKGIPTGIPFAMFYKASFQEMVKITEKLLPWNYVTVDNQDYHSIRQMTSVIKENLPSIIYSADAMYDENQKLVMISSGKEFDPFELESDHLYLSSAGFVKWIADGLVEPIAGNGLKRTPLIMETTKFKENGFQGVMSEKYSLSFSLNWVRNLASALISVYTTNTYMFNEAGVDVTLTPFAMTISKAGVKDNVSFVEDSGYSPSVLKSLMYVLAATEPGTFYFGAIRETDRSVEPEVKTFNDCVAFFPYFDSNDLFNCLVFMNGRGIALEDFCRFYKDDFVYLTRVRANDEFYPLSVIHAN